MYRIRKIKTSSSAVAVQIVEYKNGKTIVIKHIGSAHTKEAQDEFVLVAKKWIEKDCGQQSLFSDKDPGSDNVTLKHCRYLGVKYFFIYEILSKVLSKFDIDIARIFLDLVIIRIIEPASKLRSIELLNELFGVKYSRKDFYAQLSKLNEWEEKASDSILKLAKAEFNFSFSIVFYDVTTLYFESFKSDGFKCPGFSKDNKPQQPQILIGLMVDSSGFPITYDIFEGKTFEGHTIIPFLSKLKQRHQIEKLTVVADAAMISFDNVQSLKENDFQYIVGARISNLSKKLIAQIDSKLKREEGESLRLNTDCGILICDYSAKRYQKDKNEMEKQIKKAKELLEKGKGVKKSKFIKSKDKADCELNGELIAKTEKLLGVKGYYTNLPPETANSLIIDQYHKLWRIEQAFRVAKNDLEIRPIYHFKKSTIEAHILICFIALAVCKYIEIKTGQSINYIVRLLKTVTDAEILNTLTGETIIMRSEISQEMKKLFDSLSLTH